MKKQILETAKLGFQWPMENPFLFCAHHKDHYPQGDEFLGVAPKLHNRKLGSDFSGNDGYSMYHGTSVPGFPFHPHRGFETITVTLDGVVDHFDSNGAYGRYGDGDVQWMTTGKGCLHAEMFPLVHSDKDNPLELFQIWLNLPAASKKAEPDYKMFWKEDIPVFRGNLVDVKVIAGNYEDLSAIASTPVSWASNRENGVRILLVHLQPGGVFTLEGVDAEVNRNLYYYQGNGTLQLEDEVLQPKYRAKLDSTQSLSMNATEEAWFLLLEAKPIHEPVYSYGPFVMNTREEVIQAYRDYEENEFGGWPYPKSDPVHEKDAGRFARYPDGTLETKS
ncbi:MAG: pirin family protein [Candidatus Izemoplasmatales bacterium]|nr:pirin family protein [Candidatus Izemoplasmatales bacterium]